MNRPLRLTLGTVALAALAAAPATRAGDDGDEIACATAVRSVRAAAADYAVAAGAYHYRLVLPSSPTADPVPCLFVFSPGGDARLGRAADFVRRRSWAAVLLVESRNGPMSPAVGNFLAAYDDLAKHVRVQPGMLFATGQSGGARVASLCAELRPGFAGLLLQGATWWLPPGTRPPHTFRQLNPTLAVAATFGDRDPERPEALSLRHDLPAGTPYRWDVFAGGHQWAPAETAEAALDWLDRQAVLHGSQTAAMRAYVGRRVKAELATADDAARPAWERFAAADFVRQIAAARPAVKVDVARRLAALSTDPAVVAGRAALARLDAIAATEAAVRDKPASSADAVRAAAVTAAADYGALATAAPDTAAGREAARLAADRRAEAR